MKKDIVPIAQRGMKILTAEESLQYEGILSVGSHIPYYPYMTLVIFEEGYVSTYKVQCWTRIHREGVWYRVMCSESYAVLKGVPTTREEASLACFQKMVLTTYKVQHLYQVLPQVIEKSVLEIDPIQIDERERLMRLLNKGFL